MNGKNYFFILCVTLCNLRTKDRKISYPVKSLVWSAPNKIDFLSLGGWWGQGQVLVLVSLPHPHPLTWQYKYSCLPLQFLFFILHSPCQLVAAIPQKVSLHPLLLLISATLYPSCLPPLFPAYDCLPQTLSTLSKLTPSQFLLLYGGCPCKFSQLSPRFILYIFSLN